MQLKNFFLILKTTENVSVTIFVYYLTEEKKVGWTDLDRFMPVLGLASCQRKDLGLSLIESPLGEEIV